jgi:Fe-S-cluster containining protein
MEIEKWVTGKVVLKVGGYPVEMELTVPAPPVKPHRMLPIFQQMTNSIVSMSEDAVREAGEEISCKMGCGACCRQPVPIAETEVYQIAALVEDMPEPRRTVIKQRFIDANKHFAEMGWFDRIAELAKRAKPENENYISKDLAHETMGYFHEGIACPFLENESCSIHESRPLSCREYLVTSPAENCAKPTAESIEKVPLLLHPSRSMRFVGRTGKLSHWGLVPLIRALEFAEQYPETFAVKTGERWAAEFFEQLAHQEIPESGIKPSRPRRKRPRQKKRKNS